ncbi:hypothetical protein PoB_004859800 [Plakobranchus ocellatus]|uniref:Uncharacterized protein n=1 Tax=Plakobranchus ocellatus TaxID=259542 RepID=A0AAV4BTH9_9GAST|nr:hypothetical protein PoB_004859800 [Plakobranchus ocellatus]
MINTRILDLEALSSGQHENVFSSSKLLQCKGCFVKSLVLCSHEPIDVRETTVRFHSSVTRALKSAGGVGGTMACESALRSAWTILSRVRAPPSAPRLDVRP